MVHKKSLGQLDKSQPLISQGMGSVRVQNLVLDEVLFVPESGYNLISVSKLTRNNFKVHFNNQGAIVEGLDLYYKIIYMS